MGSKLGPKSPILSTNVFWVGFFIHTRNTPTKRYTHLSLSSRNIPIASHRLRPIPPSLPARASPHSHVVGINQLLLLSRSFMGTKYNFSTMEYDEQAIERRWGERFGSTKKRGKKGVEREGRWKAWSIREGGRSHHPRNPESRVSSFPGGNPQALRFSRIILWSLLLLVLRCIAFSLFPTACFLSFSRDGSIWLFDFGSWFFEDKLWARVLVYCLGGLDL